jgi:hypothetical protein
MLQKKLGTKIIVLRLDKDKYNYFAGNNHRQRAFYTHIA